MHTHTHTHLENIFVEWLTICEDERQISKQTDRQTDKGNKTNIITDTDKSDENNR